MSTFKKGYETFIRLTGASSGANSGDAYVENVNIEIEKFAKSINEPRLKIVNLKIYHAKGHVAEWWHEGTFNINAALKGSKNQADAPRDNGIVDIFLASGEKYQVKYYKTGAKSADDQAKTNLKRYMEYLDGPRKGQPKSMEEYLKGKYPNDPYYWGQGRIVPSDQLEDARKFLEEKIKSKELPPEQVKSYQDALDFLTDRMKSADGTESIPLTEKEAMELAKLAKEAGFDPAEWGLTTEDLIGMDYIMEQAFKAGLSAALMSVVLKIAPEICGIIFTLIKDGEINAEQFKRLGFAAIDGGAEGFVRGTVAAAITTACKAGQMGEALKSLNPSIIGAVTAIAMNAIQNACLLAFGKISKHEFANRCCQDFVITACSIGLGVASSAAASVLFTPAAAVFGYMIGSFVGSVIGGFVYKGIYSCAISFCIESGNTFFGLVEQNYELPKEVLEKTGVEVFEYEKFEPQKFNYDTFKPIKYEYERFMPIKIGVTFLRRGVIGVGAIGYI